MPLRRSLTPAGRGWLAGAAIGVLRAVGAIMRVAQDSRHETGPGGRGMPLATDMAAGGAAVAVGLR